MWTPRKDRFRSKEGPKGKYMKNKTLDYDEILHRTNLPLESLRVTGNRRILTNMALDEHPQAFLLNKRDIEDIQTKNRYVTNDVVDALLSLVDKEINEEYSNLGTVKVYFVQHTRLILTGEDNLVSPGKFVTVMPRYYALDDYEDRRADALLGGGEGSEPGSHYTLASNIFCEQDEVNVYETFGPFQTEKSLLNEQGKKILKILSNCETKPLKVNAINVKTQEECECGLLACALAVQLCFHAADEGAVFKKVLDVRKTTLQCLQNNALVPFKTSGKHVKADDKILFSIQI